MHTYVCKVIGDSGTVASGMTGEQTGTPTPMVLHWKDIYFNSLGPFVYLCPDYLHVVFPCFFWPSFFVQVK